MKRIFLFRHGKVDIKDNQRIFAYEFKNWIENYNKCDIVFDEKVKTEYEVLLNNLDIVVCSNLRRSIQTAEFFDKKPFKIDAVFNEAEIPYAKFSILKFTPKTWLFIFRIMWFFGFSKNSESYKEAKIRAKKASLELINLSEKYDEIILFGHGIFNRLLFKELLLRGWKVGKKLENKNWGYGIVEQVK